MFNKRQEMNDKQQIKRIVKLTFREEHCEDFIAIFKESKHKIGNFPGNKSVELLRGKKSDNIFFTFSVWESEADLEKYRKSDVFKSTWSKVKPLFADKPEAWTVINPVV